MQEVEEWLSKLRTQGGQKYKNDLPCLIVTMLISTKILPGAGLILTSSLQKKNTISQSMKCYQHANARSQREDERDGKNPKRLLTLTCTSLEGVD